MSMSWIMRSITTRVLLHARHEGAQAPRLDEDRALDDLPQLLHGAVEPLHVADVQRRARRGGRSRRARAPPPASGVMGFSTSTLMPASRRSRVTWKCCSVGTATLATSTARSARGGREAPRVVVRGDRAPRGRDRRRRRRPGRRPTAPRRPARGTGPCARRPRRPARSPAGADRHHTARPRPGPRARPRSRAGRHDPRRAARRSRSAPSTCTVGRSSLPHPLQRARRREPAPEEHADGRPAAPGDRRARCRRGGAR